MRVVVAPDKFKRSLEAAQVADAIDRGLRRARPDLQTTIVPMADGGEGTVAATIAAGAQAVERIVRGPLGSPARAVFALDGPTAVVEMARASGLTLLAPADRDARRASSYGTGELLRAALDAGVTRIVVGIGGSASNDGGAGMLAALGVRLLDARGVDVPLGGAALRGLARIDVTGLDPRLRDVDLTIAADVDNPLCGPTGASAVFGPQKGATRDQVRELDAALAHFADLSAAVLGRDLRDTPGSGAAGGLGFALLSYLHATLRPGIEVIAELRGLPGALAGADLCMTGEGRIDDQTLRGKTVLGVARYAAAAGVPVVAFGGRVDPGAERALAELGIVAVPIVDRPMTLATALADAANLIERAAERVMRLRV